MAPKKNNPTDTGSEKNSPPSTPRHEKGSPFVAGYDAKKAIKNLQRKKLLKSEGDQHEPNITDYTFLNPNNVYQQPEIVALMFEATENEPIELVSFKPERALLHTVAVAMTVLAQYKGEDERNKMIVKETQKLQAKLVPKYENLYLDIHTDMYERILNNGDLRNDQKYPELAGIVERIKEKIQIQKDSQKLTLPCDYANYNENELIAEIATSIIYKDRLYSQLRKEVKTAIEADHSIPKKTKPKDRLVFLLSGGAGSGKSTTQAILLAEAEKMGIAEENIVPINSDSYRALLLAPVPGDIDKALVYSPLTSAEAKNMLRDEAMKMVDKEGMHTLLDHVTVKKRDFDYAHKYGVSGIYVSTKAETALERSYARGIETGRHVSSKTLLEGHRSVVTELEERLREQTANQLPLRLRFFDNNVPKNSLPSLFMEIDYLHPDGKMLTIYDHEKLTEFIKKKFINPEAKSINEIYQPSDPKMLEKEVATAKSAFIDKLEKQGFKIEENPAYQAQNKNPFTPNQ